MNYKNEVKYLPLLAIAIAFLVSLICLFISLLYNHTRAIYLGLVSNAFNLLNSKGIDICQLFYSDKK